MKIDGIVKEMLTHGILSNYFGTTLFGSPVAVTTNDSHLMPIVVNGIITFKHAGRLRFILL